MFATLVFALTLVMIALHGGEWLLLGRLARAAKSQPLKPTPFPRLLKLMNFLRLEALYYVVLLAFWWTHRGAVPAAAVFLLGAVHVGGWAALESRKSAPQIEVVAQAVTHGPNAEAAGARLRRLLAGIAAFDAAEVLVLAYLAYRLWLRL